MDTIDKNELDSVVNQIRRIILGKPITDEMRCKSEAFQDIQGGLNYLQASLTEANMFINDLAAGNLDTKIPEKSNYFAGSLKELHSGLKHLSWQANQVANGDYSQNVSFLGDFSTSFNTMVEQLSERESKLKKQSNMLADTVEMFKSIVNGLSTWIVVLDNETKEMIFVNEAAKSIRQDKDFDTKYKNLNQYFADFKYEHFNTERICREKDFVFQVKSFFVRWNDKYANVHYILDITEQSKQEEKMKTIAYRDELTNLFNRRYAVEVIEAKIAASMEFSLCLIDLDGLKYANDVFGHAEGDTYLKTIAKALELEFVDLEVIARIGGDEFALVSNRKIIDLERRMEKVNNGIKNMPNLYPMSFSYGIVHVDSGDKDVNIKSLSEEADEKMYAYKKAFKIQRG